MLRSLSVKNFAVIEELRLDLEEGLNALTGETGAGKSILIESLGFLLGGRGSASWLRAGAERLEVCGVFDSEDFPREVRAQFKITEATVPVRRELDASGKTRAIVNNQTAPVAVLASLGEGLVDFHGQHDHQLLLKPAVQMELLDRYGGHESELQAAARAYDVYAAFKAELDSAQMSDEERRRRVDLLRYQLQELSDANLRPGEDEELEEILPRLKNADRLKGFAGGAYELLYEAEGSILAQLLKAERALEELSRIDATMRPVHDGLESARLALDEAAHAVGAYRDKVELDPGRLDAALGRLEALSRVKKKYGPSLAEAIENKARLAQELSRLENSQARLEDLEKGLDGATKSLEAASERLHEARMKTGKKLEAALTKELKPLGMPDARVSVGVEMEEGRFSPAGSDLVEFLLAANAGEPLRPVRAVASGGELSRVMLAFKTVLVAADRVPVLVFDEVDAGIGGAVARAVGERLAELGRARQVLCVTHLPQVAGWAFAQFHVAKETAHGRTRTSAERLSDARRLEVLAVMLGGREATDASRRHAEELLASSRPRARAAGAARSPR